MRGSGPDMGYPCDVVRAPRRVLGRAVLSEMDGEPMHGAVDPDHLCLHIVARDDNPDGRVRYVPLGPSAQEVLESFERHIAGCAGGRGKR